MDDHIRHYAKLLKIKQARLNELETQEARYGIDTPPHIAMERVSLHEEVEMLEKAIQSPARPAISDELGAAGRFQVYYQQNREIAIMLSHMSSENMLLRTWLLIIGVVIVIILTAVGIIVGYLLARGGL